MDRFVAAEVVAHAAGASLADLRECSRRDRAMAEMAAGAGLLLRGWHGAGRLAAVLAVGGSQGTAVAAAAMRPLPYGLLDLPINDPRFAVEAAESLLRHPMKSTRGVT